MIGDRKHDIIGASNTGILNWNPETSSISH